MLQTYVQHVPHDLNISVAAHLHIISKLEQTGTDSVTIGRVLSGTTNSTTYEDDKIKKIWIY